MIRSRPLVLVALLGAALALAPLEVGSTAIAALAALVLAGLAMRAIASTASASPVTSASAAICSAPESASALRSACSRKLASGVLRSGVDLASTANARQAANAPGKIALGADGRRQDTFFTGTTHGRTQGPDGGGLFASPLPGAADSPAVGMAWLSPQAPQGYPTPGFDEVVQGVLEAFVVEPFCVLAGCNPANAPEHGQRGQAPKTITEEFIGYGTLIIAAVLGARSGGVAGKPSLTAHKEALKKVHKRSAARCRRESLASSEARSEVLHRKAIGSILDTLADLRVIRRWDHISTGGTTPMASVGPAGVLERFQSSNPMDQSKIENFHRNHHGQSFPMFEALSQRDCEALRSRLAHRLGLNFPVSALELVQSLHASPGKSLGEVPIDRKLDVRHLLNELLSSSPKTVLLNWYRFDDVDRMHLDDLSRHFDDVWYPAVDDLEVFDESCEWFLSISHDGRVGFIRI